jgi:hypothetical protein
MKTTILRLAVFAVFVMLADAAMAHGCEDRLPRYLRGYYEGDCDPSNDMPQGHGEAKGADSYVGNWDKGQPSGKGVYTWENGARYEGEFKNGKVDGTGLYISSKGKRYEGGFTAGKLNKLEPADCPTTPGPLNC